MSLIVQCLWVLVGLNFDQQKNSIWRSDFLCFPPLRNFCIFAIFTTKKKSAQKLVWQHLAKNLIRFFAKLLWATKKSTPLFYEKWLSTIDESPNRRKELFTDTWLNGPFFSPTLDHIVLSFQLHLVESSFLFTDTLSNFPFFSVTLRHSHWKRIIFLSFFYLNEKSRNTCIEE